MIEGESGILSLYAHLPEDRRPVYYPSKRRVVWPNGAIATAYTAEKPARLRGPQHDAFWADELAAWSVSISEKDRQTNVVRVGRPPAWDQLMFGLRLGQRPRGVVTTTPRNVPLIRELMHESTTVVTKGTTYDNADNLAPAFLGAIVRAFEGTRIGRQEIGAELLDDNPSALWKQALIDETRISDYTFRESVELVRLAVAIDPAVTSNAESDLTGIIGGAIGKCHAFPRCQGDLHGFVLQDASGIHTPAEWARKAVSMYQTLEADRIIGEVNNGGDLVEANIRANGGDPSVPYKAVRASRGKEVRAEPVAGIYEQRRVHHVGTHGKLEDEMTQWDPVTGQRSPSRLDAMVWLMSEMMLKAGVATYESWGTTAPRRM
jgi:phage terminase large subunit-like protein